MCTMPKRYKPYGVGKCMGASIYVHSAYESVLPQEPFQRAKALIPSRLGGAPYTLVKYNQKTGAFTFIWCSEFDAVAEPSMDHGIICSPDPSAYMGFAARTIWTDKENPWIYHHKWLMVTDAYKGFDVSLSKTRSNIWLNLKNVDKSRIGKKSYWVEKVLPLLKI